MVQAGQAPIVFVIVAHGDCAGDLGLLLESLGPQYDGPVLVVCNDVASDAAALVRACAARQPELRVIPTPTNIGYGPAINLARRHVGDDAGWMVIGNADLVFPDGSIEAMQRVLGSTEPDVGCVAPRLLDSATMGGHVQPSVGRFPTLASLLVGRLRPRTTRKYVRNPSRAQDIEWATGACLALRLNAFDDVAGFDEEIFLDYEETDLCRRLADAGWRRRHEPEWSVVHTRPNAQRPADPDRHQHTRAGLVRYLAKHRPAWELHAMGALMRITMVFHSTEHPFAPGWRRGHETYSKLRGRQIS